LLSVREQLRAEQHQVIACDPEPVRHAGGHKQDVAGIDRARGAAFDALPLDKSVPRATGAMSAA